MISIKKFLKSTSSAAQGLQSVFKTEQNFRVQCYMAIFVLLLSTYFNITKLEWMIILLLILLVLLTEIVNTVIEKFNDLLKPRLHHYVYAIKNIMAGAVLLVSAVSLIIGLIVFVPYFINFVK